MITRSQTDRRALKDASNRITPGLQEGDCVVNEGDADQQKGRYNLRPRKNTTKEAVADEGANGQRSKKNGKKTYTKKQKRQGAAMGTVNTSMVPYQYSAPAHDIDECDSGDPQFVTDYVQGIYEHFRSKESLTSVHPFYMKGQQHINENMRSMLINWLIEVHLKFKLVPETLYLAVNILDRYLAKAQVTRPELQLVGIAALWISSKYEEIWEIALGDCVCICDETYDKHDILEMEGAILEMLDYRVSVPSAHDFLIRYLRAAHADTKIVQLSYFILDGTLPSYYLLHFLPSQLAAAAIFIARKTVGRNPWSPTLLEYARYREEEVLPVVRAVMTMKIYCSAGLYAVNKKYAHTKYGGVSNIELCSDLLG